MKNVVYTAAAANDLRTYRSQAERIMNAVSRYAATGAGDVRRLVGADGVLRLRVGQFRVIFTETTDTILVTKIGVRGAVYR